MSSRLRRVPRRNATSSFILTYDVTVEFNTFYGIGRRTCGARPRQPITSLAVTQRSRKDGVGMCRAQNPNVTISPTKWSIRSMAGG